MPKQQHRLLYHVPKNTIFGLPIEVHFQIKLLYKYVNYEIFLNAFLSNPWKKMNSNWLATTRKQKKNRFTPPKTPFEKKEKHQSKQRTATYQTLSSYTFQLMHKHCRKLRLKKLIFCYFSSTIYELYV